MANNFNGFASEEQYLKAFEMLKNIQEGNDTYDRDTLMVYKEEKYVEFFEDSFSIVEFFLDSFSIRIWGESVEVYILDEKEHLVDNGIMNVCWTILQELRNGNLDFMFD